jgi:hypothetical protein
MPSSAVEEQLPQPPFLHLPDAHARAPFEQRVRNLGKPSFQRLVEFAPQRANNGRSGPHLPQIIIRHPDISPRPRNRLRRLRRKSDPHFRGTPFSPSEPTPHETKPTPSPERDVRRRCDSRRAVRAGTDRHRQSRLARLRTPRPSATAEKSVFTYTGVNDSYDFPFNFTGTINKLTIKIGPSQLSPADKKDASDAIRQKTD